MISPGVRRGFTYAFLVLYVLWGLGNIGVTGLLMSFAIGLVASSFDMTMELVVALVILTGILYKSYWLKKEGFQPAPTGQGANLLEISRRVQQMEKRRVYEPSGVTSSNFAEGFADASGDVKKEEAPAASESKPAPTTAPTASTNLVKDLPTPGAAGGMFKLGEVPSDAANGPHIDVGTTLMNALNSLKPDQVKQMTDDTRKLMETQKSLMGMLTTMKPMIQDGKQMMDAFQEMFGNQK